MFKSKLNDIFGHIDHREIETAIKKTLTKKLEKEDLLKEFLDKLNFTDKLCTHPLMKKPGIIDWGGIYRDLKETKYYSELNKKLLDIQKRGLDPKDVVEIHDILNNIRDWIINYIVTRVSDVEQGLRRIHALSCVAKSEGRNLHFGEIFTQDTLYKLASRLCDSIALGRNMGIYSEDVELISKLQQLAITHTMLTKFIIPLRELKVISAYEEDYPHVTFLRFVLWLKDRLEVTKNVNEKKLIASIIEKMLTSSIYIFFIPPDKAKWSIITLPRVDFFISKWIEKYDGRKRLQRFTLAFDDFINTIQNKARKKGELKKLRNIIDIVMNHYEILCREIINYGIINFYALKGIIDIVIDLSISYNVEMPLYQFMGVSEY